MRAELNDLSVYIYQLEPIFRQTEVFCISFPRFNGSHCSYFSIIPEQRERLAEALKNAQEIVDRFIADGREDASSAEIQKAFDRNWQ